MARYTNPGWANGGPPAINAENLNDMSNELELLDTELVALYQSLHAIGLDIQNNQLVISPVTE